MFYLSILELFIQFNLEIWKLCRFSVLKCLTSFSPGRLLNNTVSIPRKSQFITSNSSNVVLISGFILYLIDVITVLETL